MGLPIVCKCKQGLLSDTKVVTVPKALCCLVFVLPDEHGRPAVMVVVAVVVDVRRLAVSAGGSGSVELFVSPGQILISNRLVAL